MHDIYQLLYVLQEGELAFDALGENPGLARELVSAMRTGLTLQGAEGIVEFHAAADFAGLGRELGAARAVGSEQSNTSIVFDETLILKVFRRLEPGINPELELLRFLTERGFENHPALGGWYEYSGGPLATTLGILQEFVAGAVDGWDAGARRDRRRAGALPRPAAPPRRGDRPDAQRARLGSVRRRRSRRRSRASSRWGC